MVADSRPDANVMPAPLVASESPARPAPCEEAPQRLEIHIPLRTFLKVFAALLTAYAVYMLWPLLLSVFLALFLAVTLNAFVNWLEARGMPRWGSLTVVIGLRDGVSESKRHAGRLLTGGS